MTGLQSFLPFYVYIRPIIDILVLTFILYKIFDFISRTNSSQIFTSVIIIGIGYGIALLLDLQTLLWILDIIAPSPIVFPSLLLAMIKYLQILFAVFL